MRGGLRSVLVLMALSVFCMSAQAGMIINGSFEAPLVTVGGFTTFSTGSTAITGWRVVGPNVSVISGTFSERGIAFEAKDGQQWLDLTGHGTNSNADGVTQDVATAVGQMYRLTFYVGSATDGSLYFPSTVDLSINGGTRIGFTNPTAPTNMLNWESFTVDFMATGSTTNISFYNGSAINNNLSGLDSVSLEPLAVPEPSGLILAGTGAVVMLGYGRRRRR